MMAGTAADVLRIAAAEIGYSRWNDPAQGTKYGRWYAEQTKSPYFGTNGVPYCAMFVSWVFAQAKASAAGLPGAYCPTMLGAGKATGKAVATVNAQPGDIVCFDFTKSGITGHVGIVEKNTGTYLVTIEGNTSSGTAGSQANGGVVARRSRAYGYVAGIIRPDWTAQATKPTQTPTQSTTGAAQAGVSLLVDGWVGPATIKALQARLGTPVDGLISGQASANRIYLPAVTAIAYGGGGSLMVAALQARLGATPDGYLGPQTVKAWQRRLGATSDGYLGRDTGRAIQRHLNTGKEL